MYAFKLQVPLDYRKRLEEDAQKEYAQAERGLLEEEGRLSDIEKMYLSNSREYMLKQEKNPNVEILKLYRRFFNRVKTQNIRQELLIEEKKKERDGKRELFLEAMKKKKALEILKEKRLTEYNRTMERRERKAMDEISVNNFMRAHHET